MSTVNGPISRSETLARAQDWVNRQVPYSQSAFTSGPNGEGSYRQDCSGMVSMAWHLDRSETTSTLPNRCTAISLNDVRPGDAVRYPTTNGKFHIALVAAPPAGGSVEIYQEREPGFNAMRTSNPLSLYKTAYRYNNITEDAQPTPIGSFDAATAGAGFIDVSGWAMAKSTAGPINVRITIDGTVVANVVANIERPDLAGLCNGTAHGFESTVSAVSGTHTVDVHGVNGSSISLLGTKTVTVADEEMLLVRNATNGAVYLLTGYGKIAVTGTDYAAFQAVGIKVVNVTAAQFAEL